MAIPEKKKSISYTSRKETKKKGLKNELSLKIISGMIYTTIKFSSQFDSATDNLYCY